MVATRYCISFHSKISIFLGLNTSQIKCHFKHLKFTSQENNNHEIHFFQPKDQNLLKIS
jgi:hypothetical protein